MSTLRNIKGQFTKSTAGKWFKGAFIAVFVASIITGLSMTAEVIHKGNMWVESKFTYAATDVYVSNTLEVPEGVNTEGIDPAFIKQLAEDAKKIMDDPKFLENAGCSTESLKIKAFGDAANRLLIKSSVIHDRTATKIK